MTVDLKDIKEVEVFYKEDLAKHYLQKFVSCSDLLDDKNILIIEKNHSVKLICNNKPMKAVIWNAAKKFVLKHFGAKMKLTVKAHYTLNHIHMLVFKILYLISKIWFFSIYLINITIITRTY